MKRWTIVRTLLSTTVRIRPPPFVLHDYRSCYIQLLSSMSTCKIHHNSNLPKAVQQQEQHIINPLAGRSLLWWSSNSNDYTRNRTFVSLRGGSESGSSSSSDTRQKFIQSYVDAKSPTVKEQEYTVLSDPAPGSPFHYAFPVHDLQLAKDFYGNVLGCVEGRSSTKWQDYSLHGHQIVAHWVGDSYRCRDYYNPVDGDEVPVPHTGLALTVDQFHDLAIRLRKAGVQFIIEPHLRFKGMPGEQYTMFFKDPSGNNLEFKAMTHPENLFAKYNVD